MRILLTFFASIVVSAALYAPPAMADITELFYVNGTFTNLVGQTETLASSSTVTVDVTKGLIINADLSVGGANFTGTPVDVANSYTWSYGSFLAPYTLTLDVPPLLENNLVNFTGGATVGVLTLPLPFGVSGSDTLEMTNVAPEPASMVLFGTGILVIAVSFLRRRPRLE